MKSLTLAESHPCICLEQLQMRTSYSPLFIAFKYAQDKPDMSLIWYNVLSLQEWIWLFSDFIEVMVTVL